MEKVSMIIPCYNVEEYKLSRMLNSVLNQSYKNIEVIMVNDGSTDDTLRRLNIWKKVFNEKGFAASVFSKSNGGIASAVNVGLLYFSGNYVCFPDADDILAKEYTYLMLTYLKNNPHIEWVRCFGEIVNEDAIGDCVSKIELPDNFNDDKLFLEYLLLRVNPVVWLSMIRSDFLKKCIPTLKLYENYGPQEWQLVLPFSFYGACGHVSKVLYTHINYSNSHFHKTLFNINSYRTHMDLDRESQRNTLNSLPIKNRQLYDDIGSLGYICALRQRFGDENACICAVELSRLYEYYAKKSILPDMLYNYNKFFYYASVIMRYFLNLSDTERKAG